jgi:DNA-directed RNA polymerase specialized sigma24 family protein
MRRRRRRISEALARSQVPEQCRSTEILVQARRDPHVLSELVDDRYSAVFGLCAAGASDAATAAELTAETFAVVVRDLHRFDPAATNGDAWIENIAAAQVRHWTKRGVVDSRARRRLRVAIPTAARAPAGGDRV